MEVKIMACKGKGGKKSKGGRKQINRNYKRKVKRI